MFLVKKDNYYSYTKVWTKGDIKDDNYNKELSHEFATEEYINNIKKVLRFQKNAKERFKEKEIQKLGGYIWVDI